MYYCLNVSCLPDGEAGGVLIRALEPVMGLEAMAEARGIKDFNPESVRDLRKLTSGPGRLSEALGITRSRDNAKDMVSPSSDLQVMEDRFKPGKIAVTPRIGIVKSAGLELRYVLKENPFVSAKGVR
jgi:DNA-3-methyladenine glycosylase